MTEMSLEQAEQHLVGRYGRGAVGFADAVREWSRLKQTAAKVDERYNRVRGRAVELFESAERAGHSGDLLGYDEDGKVCGRIARTKPSEAKVRRSVSGAGIKRLKKENPKAWESARVRKSFQSVAGPDVAVEIMRTPVFAEGDVGALTSALDSYNHDPRAVLVVSGGVRMWVCRSLLVQQTDKAKACLIEIADAIGWDGDKQTFTDGWAVQLSRLQFDQNRLKEIDPGTWEKYAEDVEVPGREGTVRWYDGRVTGDGMAE